MFKPRKAAQMAAVLLRDAGGELNVLKLTKLLYLVEREAMRQFGFPLTDDRMVSMANGPVLSHTLDLINGNAQSADWDQLVEDRAGHQVRLKAPDLSRGHLDELGDDDLNILAGVWAQFGHMTQWQLVDFTHDHCPEWEYPGSSSIPIPEERVFAALGKTPRQTRILVDELRAQRYVERLFADENE